MRPLCLRFLWVERVEWREDILRVPLNRAIWPSAGAGEVGIVDDDGLDVTDTGYINGSIGREALEGHLDHITQEGGERRRVVGRGLDAVHDRLDLRQRLCDDRSPRVGADVPNGPGGLGEYPCKSGDIQS